MSSNAPTLHDIVNAHHAIRRHVRRTPLLEVAASNGAPVLLKLESLQPTHSFKIRGALNAALALVHRGARANGEGAALVTASAGNHGQALAYAARLTGIPLTVFTPRDAPRTKQDAIVRFGAELRAEAAAYDETEPLAMRHARHTGAIYVSPYDDAHVIAGAGTVALEMLDDCPALDTIAVPLGGGGLLSGVAIAVRALAPQVRVVGVEPANNPAFTSALAAGRIVTIDPRPTIADGLSGNMAPESMTFAIVRELVDDVVTVTEDDIREGMRALLSHAHLVAEGAGAAAYAACLCGRVTGARVSAIVSGANVDLPTLLGIMQEGRS